MEKVPEIIVYLTTRESSCSQCHQALPRGNFLYLEGNQPLCVHCTGLNELLFLPSGNAKLTRNSKKYSTKYAIVVKFSRARKRYERQGVLIEKSALQKAQIALLHA